MNHNFDPKKRQTLKIMTGVTSTALLASLPTIASEIAFNPNTHTGDGMLDCQLISRSDISRAHLLMRNKTDREIIAARFDAQLIKFDNTFMNMADAYIEPVVIPPQDRVMVRLNVEAGLQNSASDISILDMNSETEFLPFGTRVVALSVQTRDGLCTIKTNPILT